MTPQTPKSRSRARALRSLQFEFHAASDSWGREMERERERETAHLLVPFFLSSSAGRGMLIERKKGAQNRRTAERRLKEEEERRCQREFKRTCLAPPQRISRPTGRGRMRSQQERNHSSVVLHSPRDFLSRVKGAAENHPRPSWFRFHPREAAS